MPTKVINKVSWSNTCRLEDVWHKYIMCLVRVSLNPSSFQGEGGGLVPMIRPVSVWKFRFQWQKLQKPTCVLPITSTRLQVHTNSPAKSSFGMIPLLNHHLADLPLPIQRLLDQSITFKRMHGTMLNRAANGHHQPQHHHPCCKPTENTLDDHDLGGYQGLHKKGSKLALVVSLKRLIHSIYGVSASSKNGENNFLLKITGDKCHELERNCHVCIISSFKSFNYFSYPWRSLDSNSSSLQIESKTSVPPQHGDLVLQHLHPCAFKARGCDACCAWCSVDLPPSMKANPPETGC